jgi:hypothetical protein
MAHFSPDVMSQLRSEEMNISIGPAHMTRSPAKMRKFYRWHGTHAAWAELFRKAHAETNDAGKRMAKFIHDEGSSTWTGFGKQTPEDFIRSGISASAHEEFTRAVAKLHADRFTPGTLKPAITGGAWIVPLLYAGNPMAARLRERNRLPPLNLELSVTLMAGTPWESLTRSLAPIAHAAWEYLQQGGVVNLTMHSTWAFSEPQDGHEGFCLSIKAPLTSQAAFATVVSTQCARNWGIRFAQGLSGVPGRQHDGIPLAYWHKPGLHLLDGHGKGDAGVLAALKIKA